MSGFLTSELVMLKSVLLLLVVAGLTGCGKQQPPKRTSRPRDTESVSRVPIIPAPDYVEVTVELNSTFETQTKTNYHQVTAKCVFGTNDWFISGPFAENAQEDFWLVGHNVVTRSLITSSLYGRQVKELLSENLLGQKRRPPPATGMSYPRAGTVNIHRSSDVWPSVPTAKILWLAFCSAGYLKDAERPIPIPMAITSRARNGGDIEIELLHDELGLPKNCKYYDTNGQMICEYSVLQGTNFLGRQIPLKFRTIKLERAFDQRITARTESVGRVTSINVGEKPELPDDVRQKLRERSLPRGR